MGADVYDLAAANAALYAWVQSGPAGAAVRALLPAGADGVIPARLLPRDTGPVGALPRSPFLAWQPGPVGGRDGEMRVGVGAWYVYGDLAAGEQPILSVAAAVAAAYGQQIDIVPFARVVAGPVTAPAVDRPLSRLGCAVQLLLSRR